MGRKALLETQVTGDDGPFTRTLERAEKRAATFSSKVERNFIGIFKRDPSQRAENAVSNLIGDITGGNTARGLAQFAGRISGLGIIAGVGIGAAIDVFDKLRSSVLEVREAQNQLDKQMSKPLNLTSIEGLTTAIDNLQKKQGTLTHGFTNYLSEFGKVFTDTPGAQSLELGVTKIEEEKTINAAIMRRQAAERLRGRNELIKQNVLAGIDDPARRAIAEKRFQYQQREDTLRASPDKGTSDALKALEVEREAFEQTSRLRKADNNVRLDVEEKIARLARLQVSPDQRKQLTVSEEIKVLDAQLAAEKNPNAQRELQLQKFKKQTELRNITTNPNAMGESANPFAFGTTAARAFDDDQGFGSIAQRNKDMNDPTVYGSLGYNAAQRGEQPLPKEAQQNAEAVAAVKEILTVIKEAWSSK